MQSTGSIHPRRDATSEPWAPPRTVTKRKRKIQAEMDESE